MQNIDVRFNATSNFSKVRGELAALQSQAASLNASFARGAYAQFPNTVDQKAWKRGTDAINASSRAYRTAASSSGLLNTQQIKATSEAERYTKALQKQNLSFGEMRRHRGIMKEVYRDQLRYQRMTAQYWGTDTAGRAVTDIAIPKNVPRDLDTMRRRIGMIGNMTASAGQQFINLGKNVQWAGRQLMVGFTYPVVLFGAAAGMAAYKAEEGFAKINKVYDVSKESLGDMAAKEKELGNLRQTSIGMATSVAQKYGATLESTLAVEQELAATGYTLKTGLMQATSEVQRISALGDIDPMQTTQMVIALKTAFKITDQDLPKTLNALNAISNATSLSLQDIAEATPRAASGMAALGGTAEEMGILLVSMKEAGVNAAEGAQALKSATARILNPTILKKATEIYKSFGAKIDVQGLSEKSEGNMFKFIKLLGEAQAGHEQLTDRQKQSAVAALFGTYQFNRLTAALTNTTDAYAGVENQTKAALDIQMLSSEELAKIAEGSRKAMMENPAGKWKVAWATLKIELVEVGGAFLEIASKAAGAATTVLSAFNDMGDGKKKLALLLVGVLALAGPVIMLSGLFLNLWGQFTKSIGGMLKFIGISKLVTKEEQMATLTAEAQNKAMAAQSAATNTLAAEMRVLAAAYREATMAAQQHLGATPKAFVHAGQPGFIGPLPRKPIKGAYLPTAQEAAMMDTISNRNSSGKFISEEVRLSQARNKLAYEYMAANNQVARDATKQQKATAATARQTAAINKNMSGTAVAGSAMALSMGTMMFTSNDTANSIAKWVLISSIVVPAIKVLSTYTALAAKHAWSYAAGMNAGSLATTRAAGAKGVWASLLAGGGKFGKIVGPGGGVTLGVLAVGAGLMAWNKHLRDTEKEQARVHNSVNSLTDTWAEKAGIVAKKYNDIKIAAEGIKNSEKQASLIDQYGSGEMKGKVSDFNKFDGTERDMFVAEHYMELQAEYGLSANEAADNIRALYMVAGEGAETANSKANELLRTIGKLGQKGLSKYLGNQIDIFKGKEFGTKEAESAAKDVAKAFGMALDKAGPAESSKIIKQFIDVAGQGWKDSFNLLTETYSGLPDIFQSLGIKSADALRQAIDRAGGAEAFLANPAFQNGQFDTFQLTDMVNILEDARTVEAQVVEAVSNGTNKIGLHLANSVNSIREFQDAWLVMSQSINYTQGVGIVQAMSHEVEQFKNQFGSLSMGGSTFLTDIAGGFESTRQEQIKVMVNQLNVNNGFKEGATAAEAINNYLNRVKSTAAGAAGAANQVANSLNNIPTSLTIRINKTEFPSAYKSGMEATQNAMADSATAAFDRRWDASISAAENANASAEEGMKRRHQAALDRIQAKIDAEKRADEVRQRLFEAEKTRLQRLADMENKNIDFNQAVNEGRLDDAAKIQNDMVAQTAINAMDDEEKRAQAISDAKVARLEKQSERLQKIQERQEAAAQRAHSNQISNMQKQRDYEKAMLDQRLELFKAYTARNKKDLERWMKTVGLSYDDFGSSVKAKGKSWSEYFKTELVAQVRLAATKVASDKAWEGAGKEMAISLLKGIGFKSMPEFNKFIQTGKLPKNFDETRHDGGVVGSGGGSRGNIPNSYKGLHPTERIIRAQVGERIINRKQSKKHGPLLDAINSGAMENGVMGGMSDPAYDRGPASAYPAIGVVAGIIANMFKTGVGAAITRVAKKAPKRGQFTMGPRGTMVSTGVGGGFVAGAGGRHRPISSGPTSGIHGAETGFPALDFAAPTGRPLYAVSDGVITRSYDIPGHEPRAAHGGLGYRSYGRVIQLKTNAGPEVLYAHLSRRSASAGQKVKGGSILGYSGNTGNSTGPHLHFGSRGASPYAWLRKGGEIRWDNTPAVLHKGETVLTAPLTRMMKDNVASGGGDSYDIIIDLRGAVVKDDIDIKKAVYAAVDEREAKKGRKRVVN